MYPEAQSQINRHIAPGQQLPMQPTAFPKTRSSAPGSYIPNYSEYVWVLVPRRALPGGFPEWTDFFSLQSYQNAVNGTYPMCYKYCVLSGGTPESCKQRCWYQTVQIPVPSKFWSQIKVPEV
nr:hypothetical protein [Paenibacillus polymyxa]